MKKFSRQEKRIIKLLNEIDQIWVESIKLFAASGTLLVVDSTTNEILTSLTYVYCDGGDPDIVEKDGVEYIDNH